MRREERSLIRDTPCQDRRHGLGTPCCSFEKKFQGSSSLFFPFNVSALKESHSKLTHSTISYEVMHTITALGESPRTTWAQDLPQGAVINAVIAA
jgi:hypothetical protein